MARFNGKIGYGESVEEPPGSGKWSDVIIEGTYFGDVIRKTNRNSPGEGVNDNLTIGNLISIVSDEYAIDHFYNIRYIEYAGALWSVDNVEVQRPRLILTLGSVYNGPTAC
jgi:hypothetical protein